MKSRSPTSLQHPTLNEKTWKMKSVLVVMFIFKKSWSFWRHVWLASSLLEQILKNNSRKVPSNRPIIFVQNPTMTLPEEIRGKHGQEPRHNHVFLQKLWWEGWIEGELHHRCIMEPILVLQKKKTSVWSCLQKFLIFCFNLFQFFVGNLA
jgi:hypothetical protein